MVAVCLIVAGSVAIGPGLPAGVAAALIVPASVLIVAAFPGPGVVDRSGRADRLDVLQRSGGRWSSIVPAFCLPAVLIGPGVLSGDPGVRVSGGRFRGYLALLII